MGGISAQRSRFSNCIMLGKSIVQGFAYRSTTHTYTNIHRQLLSLAGSLAGSLLPCLSSSLPDSSIFPSYIFFDPCWPSFRLICPSRVSCESDRLSTYARTALKQDAIRRNEKFGWVRTPISRLWCGQRKRRLQVRSTADMNCFVSAWNSYLWLL